MEPGERPKPHAEPGEGSEPHNLEEFRKLREKAQRALDEKSGANFSSEIKNLLGQQLKLTFADIDRRIQDPEQAQKMKDFYKDFNDKLKKAFEKDGTFEKVYDSFLKSDSFQNLGKLDPKGKKAVNDFKNSYLDSMRTDMKRFLPDLLENISKNFTILEPEDLNTEEGRNKLLDILKQVDDFAEENAKNRADDFMKNQFDSLLDRMNDGKLDPTDDSANKSNAGRNLKEIIKWLTLLTLIGGSVSLFAWWLFLYATAHSGCQFLDAEPDKMPVSSKVICYNSGQQINIFNPNGGNIEYSSQQCNCNPSDKKVSTCDTKSCPSNNNIRPWNCNSANDECSGQIGDNEYKLYFFGIMTPLDALGNLGNGIVNGAGDAASQWLEILLKFAMYIGIIIGVLVVLFIIYKVVSSRGSSETVKVVSAPPATGTSVSKFGRYLGDLSRYSNYGLMGRCGTYGLIPM